MFSGLGLIGHMNQNGLLLILVFVALVGGYVYLSQWDRRRRFRPLIGLLDERSGEIQAGLLSPEVSLEGHFHGKEVRFLFTDGSRSTRPRFHVVISCSAPIHLEITREDVAGKIGKALRLRSDIQVGDPELDRHFIFSSPWPECLAALVRMPEARQPIESILLRGGMDSVQCDSSGLWSTRGVSFGMGAMKLTKQKGVLDGEAPLSPTNRRAKRSSPTQY